MPRKQTCTKRASYRDGVDWIAMNDNPGGDMPSDGMSGSEQQRIRDNIAGYISTILLAELFGADPHRVALDVFRHRAKAFRMERS